MDPDKFALNVIMLKHFTNNSLGIKDGEAIVNGFVLNKPILDAAAYNTYIETISNKADTLYLKIKESLSPMVTYSYNDYIKRISNRFDWKSKSVMLAFDYTDEDFYGDVQGFDIHGWKKSSSISGKFKFLTCSLISDEIPEKIPLISIPIKIGHYKSQAIDYCLSFVTPFFKGVELVLFDRGFYDKDLMYSLTKNKFPFLIFVPKHKNMNELLFPMEDGEYFEILQETTLNKYKTKIKFEYFLTFMKQIYSKKADACFDWVFATNVDTLDLETLVITYRKRWRIETGFRVQDEAKIRCKSKDMKIRYFLFMFQQLLQTQWVCFFKEEISFKKYLIEMHMTCTKLVNNPGKRFRRTQKH